MKKVFTVVFITMAIVSCQKKDIRPNTDVDTRIYQEETAPDVQQLLLNRGSGSEGGNVSSLSSTTSSTTTTVTDAPVSDSVTIGTITDPIRKKDERDRKGKP